MGIQADGLYVKLLINGDADWLRQEFDSLRNRGEIPVGHFFCVLTDGGQGEPLDYDDADTAIISKHVGEAFYLFVYDGSAAENYTFLYEHSIDGKVVRALAYGAKGWWHDDNDIKWRRVEGEPEPWEAALIKQRPEKGKSAPGLTVDAMYWAVLRHFRLEGPDQNSGASAKEPQMNGQAEKPAFDYAGYADQFAAANSMYQLMDFTPASITALDSFITEMWGEDGAAPDDNQWQPSEGKWKTILNFGIYFGEVVRRRYNGAWERDENEPDSAVMMKMALPSGLRIFPVAKVWKRFRNGIEDSIDPLMREVRRHENDQPGPGEWAEWLAQANWFMKVNRPDHAIRFFEAGLRCPLGDDARRELETGLMVARDADAGQMAEMQSETEPQAGNTGGTGSTAGPDFAGTAEKMAASLFYAGVVANYSPASVAGADISINALLGTGPATEDQKKQHADLEWELGCYLGELFCRRLGGAWHAGSPFGVPTDDPLCYHIKWPSGFMTCPFVYISKRLENGANHSIFGQFDACRKVLFERGDIPDMCDDPKEWYEQGYILGVNKQRPELGAAFLRMALKLDPNHPDALHWLAMITPETPEGNQQAHQLFDRALAAHPERQQTWVAKARRLVSAADRDAAYEVIQKGLGHLPDDPELNELLGDQLAFRKDIDGAKAAFMKGTGRGDSAHAWEGLGICRQLQGDVDGALEAWREAADRDTKKPMPCYRIAAAEDQRGNRSKAVSWYKRVLERNPVDESLKARVEQRISSIESDPEYLKVQADACAGRGDTAGAVAMYEKIAEANPKDSEAWREAGVGHAMLQQFEQALACFDQAIKLTPDDYRAWDHKAVTLGRMDKYPLGLDLLDQGLSYCLDSPSLWSRRSFFLNKLGRYQEALVSANKALQLEPDNGRHYLFKYEAERQLGQTAAAIDSITHHIDWLKPREPQKAIEAMRMRWELQHNAKLDPQTAMQLQEFAFQHWQNRDVESCLKCFQAAVESDPFSYEIWNNYGSSLSGIGKFEAALECFQKAHELYPDFSMFLENKALALGSLYRNEEALACHEEILKVSPQNERSLEERVRLLGILERWDAALAAAEALVAAFPGMVKAHKRHAWTLQQLKRFEEALAAMDRAIALAPHDRELWLAKSTILSDLGYHDEAFELQSTAFDDEAFAEKYHQDGLKLFDMLNETGQR